MTMVMSSCFAGAEMTTFFAPASMCARAAVASVKSPVDSMTTSTPRSPQGSAAGSFSASDMMRRPSTSIPPPTTRTSPSKRPRMES